MTLDERAAVLRDAVKARYAAAARAAGRAPIELPVLNAAAPTSTPKDPITRDLYATADLTDLPSSAVLASLGCGNPTALAQLRHGEVVLDLGSGGGIDVLLSARRVGPTGFAYGLDMTDEMLALARRNAEQQGVRNVQFLKGEIEHIPLPDASVDVVISNCVINLSADKPQVLREAFRVLKPRGRFAVSDVVVQGDMPPPLRQDLELWAGCIAGALEEGTYRQLLADAGFTDVQVEVTRVYDAEALAGSSCCSATSTERSDAFMWFEQAGGRLVSAFVRATRPPAVSAADRYSWSSSDSA